MRIGTIISMLVLGGIQLFIEKILGTAFYETLCEIGKIGCVAGWIAYKLPLIIILAILLCKLLSALYKLIKK